MYKKLKKFSIIIPTRERAETLKYALRTCLSQEFEDYEIIVCDNCSSPETKKVVDSFKSEKIKYVRSDRPLAMSDNWELALSYAAGEYVIFIGDDDGLLSNSLKDIDILLKKMNINVLCWKAIFYPWPNSYPETFKNYYMRIPLGQGIKNLEAKKVIKKVINNPDQFWILPQAYHSAVHRSLLDLLRKKTGRVFKAMAPDVYSGFAIAFIIENYAFAEFPLSISGMSEKSTGATLSMLGESAVKEEFCELNEKAGFGFHPQAPNCYNLAAVVADSFLRAKENLFSDESNFYAPPPKKIIDHKNLKNFSPATLNFLRFLNRISNGYLNLKTTKLRAKNVFEAAEFYQKSIYSKNKGLGKLKIKLLSLNLRFLNVLSLPARVLFK